MKNLLPPTLTNEALRRLIREYCALHEKCFYYARQDDLGYCMNRQSCEHQGEDVTVIMPFKHHDAIGSYKKCLR